MIGKPIIEEDELSEFCYRIVDSRQFDYAHTINWWKATKGDRGVIETAWGWVEKFNTTYKQIKLKNDEDYWWIPVENIVDIMEI
nr:YolD-like family protein [Brevibacillus laterosporus]